MRVPLFINECKLIEVEERQLMSRHLAPLLLSAMRRPTVLPKKNMIGMIWGLGAQEVAETLGVVEDEGG